MTGYGSLCDDYYVNMNLNTEMELPSNRETVLHFFDRVQKQFPVMRNFYCRDRNDFVLEEDKDTGSYRWASIELRRVSSGHVNPLDIDDSFEQHRLVVDLVPYMLSVSSLDCESLCLMFGFDFTYRGNHNELVTEALGVTPAVERMIDAAGVNIVSHEPAIQFALDADCRTQCRLSVETRTTAYHVRTHDYPEEQLSVYLTARRYGSLESGETFADSLADLHRTCREMLDGYVVEHVLEPLQQQITLK